MKIYFVLFISLIMGMIYGFIFGSYDVEDATNYELSIKFF